MFPKIFQTNNQKFISSNRLLQVVIYEMILINERKTY